MRKGRLFILYYLQRLESRSEHPEARGELGANYKCAQENFFQSDGHTQKLDCGDDGTILLKLSNWTDTRVESYAM